MIRGVYYDSPETRSVKAMTMDGLTLTLTDSQLGVSGGYVPPRDAKTCRGDSDVPVCGDRHRKN